MVFLNGRCYNSIDIKHLLNIYNDSLNMLFDIQNYSFHIFEKPNVKKNNDVYCDGFHVVIPEIITGYENKFKLRSIVIKQIEKQKLFSSCLLTADQILDKSIIKNNGWFLYGSSKPNNEVYKLTTIIIN